MFDIEHFLTVKNDLGEGPFWSAEEKTLYWVDYWKCKIHKSKLDLPEVKTTIVNIPIAALRSRKKGGFIVSAKSGIGFWHPENTKIEIFSNPEEKYEKTRLNDAAIDDLGRFWVGSINHDGFGHIFRIDPSLDTYEMDSEFTVANGIRWSPDNRTMYISDSRRLVIYAYDYDIIRGEVENRREFIKVQEGEGLPDGMEIDKDGYLWSVRCGGWKICQYDPAGKIVREITLPIECPTSCVFGGQELDELFITSSSMLIKKTSLKEQPLAGDVFRLRVETGGKAEQKFLG